MRDSNVTKRYGGNAVRIRRAAVLVWGASVLAAVSLTAAVGCGEETAPDGPRARQMAGRTIVLGVDGLDHRMLDEQVAAGVLPNFARFYDEGSVGTIDIVPTGLPPTSPRVWTTFVTGQEPAVHGVVNFVYPDDAGTRRLFSSDRRRSPAVWEMASSLGRTVGVVNWWATYPAEAVDGFVISDRYNHIWSERMAKFFGGEADRTLEHAVFPPELTQILAGVEQSGRYWALVPETAEPIDRDVLALAEAALEKYPVELLLLYTRSLDELSHVHWKTHEVRPGEEAPEEDLIADYLRRFDSILGDLLARSGPEDRFMVLSDHGFERNPAEGPSGIHKSESTAIGVLLLRGPGIRRGHRLGRVSALDVLPTMLELAGLPAGDDMPGKVVTAAFDAGHGEVLPRIAAYERKLSAAGATATDVDDAIIDRLKALGYMGEEGGAPAAGGD
jgi:predicted AlkP superfamily phosphohydrolase/phosphomutase